MTNILALWAVLQLCESAKCCRHFSSAFTCRQIVLPCNRKSIISTDKIFDIHPDLLVRYLSHIRIGKHTGRNSITYNKEPGRIGRVICSVLPVTVTFRVF